MIELINDMSNEDYHAAEGVNSSLLKTFHMQSPAHALAYMEGRLPRPSQEALDFGTCVHGLVLEPQRIEEIVAVAPDVDRRTKAGKAEWEKFTQEAEGRAVIKRDTYDMAIAVANRVKDHPIAGPCFVGGMPEVSAFSTCRKTGLKIKARADYMLEHTLVDLKTTTDASYWGFTSSMRKLGYYIQAGLYSMVFDKHDFVFVAVEKAIPYNVGIYRLAGDQLDVCVMLVRSILERFKDCSDNEFWPDTGMMNGITQLEVPKYILPPELGGE